jgi:hypothetical protein
LHFSHLSVALDGLCDGMNGLEMGGRVTHGTPGPSHGKEPDPWPDLVVRNVPMDGNGLFSLPAHPVHSRPEGLPAPLRLTCALLI